MFGFLSAPCRCQNARQGGVYRRFFCGLSNALARRHGPLSRFLVNRDASFLNLLTAAQAAAGPEFEAARCCNPLASLRRVCQSGSGADFAAAVTLAGVETKLTDDCLDEAGLRRRLSGGLLRLLSKPLREARQSLRELDFPVDEMRDLVGSQPLLERRLRHSCADPQEAVRPSARTFGAILAHTAALSSNQPSAGALQRIGSALGGLAYLCDSFQDYEQDLKGCRFNPLFSLTGGRPDRKPARSYVAEFAARQMEAIRTGLAEVRLRRYRRLIESILLDRLSQKVAGIVQDEGQSIPSGEAVLMPPRPVHFVAASVGQTGAHRRQRQSFCDYFCDCCTWECCDSNCICACDDGCGCDCSCCPCDGA